MSEKPAAVVLIREFPGIVSDPDELDIVRGSAQIQTNLKSDKPGRMETRPGFVEVEFEE